LPDAPEYLVQAEILGTGKYLQQIFADHLGTFDVLDVFSCSVEGAEHEILPIRRGVVDRHAAAHVFEQRCQARLVFVEGTADAMALDGIAHHARQQVRGGVTLDQVILGAGTHGFDCQCFIVEAGEYHHRDIRRRLFDALHGLHALAVW